MKQYDTEREFREEIERILELKIKYSVWVAISNFLYGAAIHAPYNDGDVEYALPKIKRLLRLLKE